jgi:hypothetical protein
VIPDHRLDLPLIDQAGDRPIQDEGRVDRDGSSCVCIDVASLAAICRAVAVFPQAFGPSMTTAPEAPSRALSSSSTVRGRYPGIISGLNVAYAPGGISFSDRAQYDDRSGQNVALLGASA